MVVQTVSSVTVCWLSILEKHWFSQDEKKPDAFRHRASTTAPGALRLGRCRKGPSRLRVQSGLSKDDGGNRRCLGSRCFRSFLRSRLLGCFLGGWLFGSGFFGGSSFLGRCFFGSGLFGWSSFFSRGFLCGSFLGWSGFLGCYRFFRGSSLFGRSSFLHCYFFSWCFFSGYSFLCGSGLFCDRFFCSCHFNVLLDQLTKSTSCELECMKRFIVLGVIPAP